jgi:tetratricopeptide (TPR) repeat protein
MLRFLTTIPVRMIAWLSDAIEKGLRNSLRIFRPIDTEDISKSQDFKKRAKTIVLRLVQYSAQVITFPIAGLFYRGARKRSYFWSLPFVVLSIGTFAVWLVVGFNQERIFNRYLAKVQNAYSKQKGSLGVRYSLRWIDDREFSNLDRKFLISLVQVQAGDEKAAESMLEHLSPEDSTGLGVAHFWRASKYAAELEKSASDPEKRSEQLERFRWHLERSSGVNPSQIGVLKALEFYWSGEESLALEAYRALWEQNPSESLGYASLLKRMGKEQERTEVLQTSAQLLGNLLRSDPWNRSARSQLAGVYESLGEWSKAELVFIEGFQISRDGPTAMAYQGFLQRRIQSALAEPRNPREIAYCLVRITRTQGGEKPTKNFVSESLLRPKQELEQLQNALNQWLVEGLDLPMVHLFLALCKVVSGDAKSGDWHLEQAYRYDDSIRGIVSQLADHLVDASTEQSQYHERLLAWRKSN